MSLFNKKQPKEKSIEFKEIEGESVKENNKRFKEFVQQNVSTSSKRTKKANNMLVKMLDSMIYQTKEAKLKKLKEKSEDYDRKLEKGRLKMAEIVIELKDDQENGMNFDVTYTEKKEQEDGTLKEIEVDMTNEQIRELSVDELLPIIESITETLRV